ncbi:acyltransferase [Dyella sp. GSA-30]|uniref:LpxL/LpxP family acyltransferase n=1 Tax=Dyella sp. GSA-30 TaxID=2994496 RepID=UPI002490F5CA|nr:acyltransferase [Dyella sp. GSA-30]BDU18881.1 acyltransferase [Dyella sp. GSA-30]
MTEHWQSRPEGGSRAALKLIRTVALHGGRAFVHALLWPITFYFMLRRGPERRASRDFLARVFKRRATFAEVFRHMRYYGATQLDRIFFLARGEREFDIRVEGVSMLESYIDQGRGVLLIGSHQGSFEALRALSSRRPGLSLRVVLDKQKTPEMTQLLEELAPQVGACVIDASRGGTSVTLAASEACRDGALVALLADRGRENETLRRIPFMGELAGFPIGPWLLAHTLKVPVVLCFGIYEGGNRYKLIFEQFADVVDIPRDRRGQALDSFMARYAARLEHYALTEPYNWFNFHDFWQNDVADEPMISVARPEHADA